jgi:hypothetical protein
VVTTYEVLHTPRFAVKKWNFAVAEPNYAENTAPLTLKFLSSTRAFMTFNLLTRCLLG